MLSTMRKSVVAAAAAALLSSQAVHAAPVRPAPAVDPLVALSLLGTSQSRAAVCKNAACGLPVTTAATATAASPAVATAGTAAAVQGVPGRRESRGVLGILALGGLMLIIAVLAATLAGDEDEPVSPE